MLDFAFGPGISISALPFCFFIGSKVSREDGCCKPIVRFRVQQQSFGLSTFGQSSFWIAGASRGLGSDVAELKEIVARAAMVPHLELPCEKRDT